MIPYQLLECVPNFSEGRDLEKIAAIASTISDTPGVQLLHVDVSPAANRTVMTFAGEPAAVTDAAFNAIKKAAELIDMTLQAGVHPRIGATDVCPLVPLQHITMQEAVKWSEQLGKRVGEELQIPVYLYEHAATAAHRRALPDIRKGQYEGLEEKMKRADWQPDYGPAMFKATTGATVIGARQILVAFNISLETKDYGKAQRIAERLRERGYVKKTGEQRTRVAGLLPAMRAIGWYMEDYHHAQVSMNLLDYKTTSPAKAYETCKALVKEMDTIIVGSEVIGLIPEECVLEAGAVSFIEKDMPVPKGKALLIMEGIEYMKLNALKPFVPREKILEYALEEAFGNEEG